MFRDLNLYYIEHKKRIRKDHIQFFIHTLYGSSGSFILTDCLKLKQIFVNLLDNAFKFTHSGKIEAGCVLDEGGNLRFYVSDTGIGISPEKQSYIFERFAQVNTETNHLYGGTGLGLSIVQGLIKAMNGEIWLQSDPGLGTTFYFNIPYKICEEPILNADETWIYGISDDLYKNKTVLIVEDDLYNGEFLIEILSETGLKMKLTGYGKEAVEMARNFHFDLILMDINLPDITGYEAVKRILGLRPYQKIIAQTAYAANEDEQKAQDAGCIGYISKPINRKILFGMLHKHLLSS
jgi:CheY-like chemotaxis protein